MRILGSQEGPSSEWGRQDGPAEPWVSPRDMEKNFSLGSPGELGAGGLPLGSPARDRMEKKTPGYCIALAAAGVIGWVLAFAFLGLYLAPMGSSPGLQLQACQSELRNRTSRAEARFASSRERLGALEAELKQARGEIQLLRTQWDVTNISLAETRGHWESCQEQLESMGENVSTQVNEATQREVEKCTTEKQNLLREISAETQQLKGAQSRIQAERDQCLAKTQQLEVRLKKASGASGRVTAAFILPGLTFLLLLFLPSL